MSKATTFLFSIILIVFASCGNSDNTKWDTGPKMYGTYISSDGKYKTIEFGKGVDGFTEEGHKVTLDGNNSTSYKVENKEVIILGVPSMGGNIMFRIIDDNTLKGENGDAGTYVKQ